MARVKRGIIKLKKRRKLKNLTKGYRGSRSRRIKTAQEALLHSLQYAFTHRRKKKRDARSLWIVRINAACRILGVSYNQFIWGLKQQGIIVNRKILAEMASGDQGTFQELVELSKTQRDHKSVKPAHSKVPEA